MKLLAVETSGADASIALTADGQLLREISLAAAGRRHARTLVSCVGTLLSETAVEPAAIDVVAVSAGPGSFTGLRVGIVFAKTFAWVNNARLVAVDTLQAIAERIPADQELVTTVIDAQRNEVFAAEFAAAGDADGRLRTGDTRIVPVADLQTKGVVCGPALQKYADQLPPGLQTSNTELWNPTAATVARIGYRLALQHVWADLDAIEPTYIRRSYAEEKRP